MIVLRAAGIASVFIPAARLADAAIIPIETNPFAPASQQVQAQFATIDGEILRLQLAGLTAQADAMRARVTHYQNQLAGTEASDGAGSELDIVECYESPNGSSAGPASVHLAVTDRPVVLALGSYESVNWTLSIDPGVSLQQVILAAYTASQITNLPPGVPLVTSNKSVGYHLDYDEYPPGERTLRTLSGNRPVTSQQGSSTAPPTAVEVGPANSDWRAQRVLREMHPLYLSATAHQHDLDHAAVASLRFSGLVQFYAGSHLDLQTSTLSRMSVDGPVDDGTQKALGRYDSFVTTPDGQTGYGIFGQTVYKVTMSTGVRTAMSITGPGVPALSWPCGVAFDSTRNRLVLASLGGEGFLYSYVDNPTQWFLMSSLSNADLQSLAYLPMDDQLYGLTNRASYPPGQYRIRKYSSSTGAFLGEVTIGAVIPSTNRGGIEGMQLMAAGDKLALLTPPSPDLYQLDQPDAYRLFIINPSDGAVIYAGVFPIPEPTTLSGLAGAAMFLMAGRRRRRRAH